ncbi:MAG: class I SAM-dependent DNA methyltransferase [Syntrophothermus sp.]
MKKNDLTSIYHNLADVYDHIMNFIDYKAWADYINTIKKTHVNKTRNILELAAGTGGITKYLLKRYPEILITDISASMLKKVKGSSRKVCCKMNELPFKNKFDFVYSCFDSVNYLTSKKELRKLFANVRQILSDDGVFTFDVSLEKNSINHSAQPVRKGEYNKIKFEQRSIYNKETLIHKNIFLFSDSENNKIYEVHRQKIYPFETYFELIEREGLYVIDCFDAFSFNQGMPNSERLQFIVKKNNYVNF